MRTGAPLSVWLGPGLVGNIYDGIQRPLPGIQARSGAWIRRGEKVEPLDVAKRWEQQLFVAHAALDELDALVQVVGYPAAAVNRFLQAVQHPHLVTLGEEGVGRV